MIWRRLRHFAYSVKVGMLGVLKESLAPKHRRDQELISQVCSYIQKGDLSYGRYFNPVNEFPWKTERAFQDKCARTLTSCYM